MAIQLNNLWGAQIFPWSFDRSSVTVSSLSIKARTETVNLPVDENVGFCWAVARKIFVRAMARVNQQKRFVGITMPTMPDQKPELVAVRVGMHTVLGRYISVADLKPRERRIEPLWLRGGTATTPPSPRSLTEASKKLLAERIPDKDARVRVTELITDSPSTHELGRITDISVYQITGGPAVGTFLICYTAKSGAAAAARTQRHYELAGDHLGHRAGEFGRRVPKTPFGLALV